MRKGKREKREKKNNKKEGEKIKIEKMVEEKKQTSKIFRIEIQK